MANEDPQFNDERDPISDLLSGLKRVDAPANFEFGVRAKIAAGKPRESKGFRIPILVKFGAPLLLVFVIGAFLGLRSMYSTGDATLPAVALGPAASTPQLPQPEATVAETAPEQSLAAVKKPEPTGNIPALPSKKTVDAKTDRSGGGSYDSTAGIAPKFYRNVQIPAKDVLNLLGAKGSFGKNGWTVDTPTASSLAERSGVRAGDVVEAINDQPVTEKTTIRSRSGLKSVRIRRDGKTIEIVLKN